MSEETGIPLFGIDAIGDYRVLRINVEGRLLCKCPKCGDEWQAFAIKQVRDQAIAEERERCAEICEKIRLERTNTRSEVLLSAHPLDESTTDGWLTACAEIAAKIRGME